MDAASVGSRPIQLFALKAANESALPALRLAATALGGGSPGGAADEILPSPAASAQAGKGVLVDIMV